MKLFNALILCLAVTSLAACSSKPKPTTYHDDREAMDAWSVQSYQKQMIDNAILADHTLYPHHFHANAAALNELGVHDLNVLAGFYRKHPGALNVRQGNTTDAIYDSRVQTVTQHLASAGVDTSRIEIADANAGGSNSAVAGRVVTILEADAAKSTQQRSRPLSTATSSGDSQ